MVAVLGICALIFSVIALVIAAIALIEVKAMARSTHQVTFLDPTKQDFQAITDDLKTKIAGANDALYDNIN